MGMFSWLPFGKVPEISPAQLHALIDDASQHPQVIDVRLAAEWRAGRVPGAINIPITQLDERIGELHLDPTRPIVAICRSAHRSIPAVRILRRHGFDNATQLQGGMLAWWKAGLPLEGAE